MDCNNYDSGTAYGNDGCLGGFAGFAFHYTNSNPLSQEIYYQYQSRDGTCKKNVEGDKVRTKNVA